MKKTYVICGATGIGKTTVSKDPEYNAVDLEPGKFRWGLPSTSCLNRIPEQSEWPGNYCGAIVDYIGKVDLVLISSHPAVINELLRRGIAVTLVYPDPSQKEAYRDRYTKRGNTEAVVELLISNFDNWITAAMDQQGCRHIVLSPGQYLADVIPQIMET